MQHRQRDGVWTQYDSRLIRGLVCMIVLTLILLSCAPASGGNTTPGTTSLTVYVGAAPAGRAGIVYALRGDTGVPRWHARTDATFLTLALANGVVYTAGSRFTSSTGSGSLSALRASDGSLLWQVSVDSPGLSTPLVASGVLYVASILDGMVYALHTRDGSPLWRGAPRQARSCA